MRDLYLIFKNITRKKLRLFLILFATFIAFMIYGTLMAFQDMTESGVELSASNRLTTVNKVNFTQPLPISYNRRIKTIEGVVDTTYFSWFGGYYREPVNQIITFAIEPDNFFKVYREIIVAEKQKQAWLKNRKGLLIGQAIAKRYGWKVGDQIPLSSNIYSKKNGGKTWDFVVEAIYTQEDPQLSTNDVYFHYQYFNESRTFGIDYIGFISILTADVKLNERIIQDVDRMFANSFFETETMPEKAFVQGFIKQGVDTGLIIVFAVLASFFIILVIVGNSMVLSIRERTAEIAVLKTVGFNSGRIFRMILFESLLIAWLGGSLGLCGSALLVEMINMVPTPLPQMVLKPAMLLKSALYISGLGLITGIIPAFLAWRLNVVSGLAR